MKTLGRLLTQMTLGPWFYNRYLHTWVCFFHFHQTRIRQNNRHACVHRLRLYIHVCVIFYKYMYSCSCTQTHACISPYLPTHVHTELTHPHAPTHVYVRTHAQMRAWQVLPICHTYWNLLSHYEGCKLFFFSWSEELIPVINIIPASDFYVWLNDRTAIKVLNRRWRQKYSHKWERILMPLPLCRPLSAIRPFQRVSSWTLP